VSDVYPHLPPIASLHWGLRTLYPSDNAVENLIFTSFSFSFASVDACFYQDEAKDASLSGLTILLYGERRMSIAIP